MKVKVKATYYVDTTSWRDAEHQVEQRLAEPDTIESEPSSNSSRDMLLFALSAKLEEKHRDIYFNSYDDVEYKKRLEQLKEEINIWLTTALHDVISNNEEIWS